MNKENYKARLIDETVDNYLEAFGAVCIEGPKWCGKTWTSSYHSNSEIYIGSSEGNFQNRTLAQMSPSLVLEGETPRLIDEWQEAPALWDAVRYHVDQNQKKGQFILTGSATPKKEGRLHSGAGRIARLRMRPMSLYESGQSSGDISLRDICNNEIKEKFTGEVDLRDLIDYIVRGGWPANQDISLKSAALLPQQYIKAILEDDINRVDDTKYNIHKMQLLLRSLARNETTTITTKTIKRDIKEVDEEVIDEDTLKKYMNLLDRLFLLDNQPPFSSSLRSSVRVKQAEKRHFCDPSLAVALLRATPEMLLRDLNTTGFLFEALVERDLRIYAESFGAELYHYQDYYNKEIDAIIALQNDEWVAIEIKLGFNKIDEGATNLIDIYNSIKKEGGKLPKAMVVICGMSNAAYRRKDGVIVVPITALKD